MESSEQINKKGPGKETQGEARRPSPGEMPGPRARGAIWEPEEVRVTTPEEHRSSPGDEPATEEERIPIQAAVSRKRRRIFQAGSCVRDLEFQSRSFLLLVEIRGHGLSEYKLQINKASHTCAHWSL